ncbi:hypothetical protein MG290_03310 [Flavobacterium sp. CBA20B-1]|uniref:hypothetical protein n=1 Tax=unclassified Flavobacterium TaxID=196869 RepID=UPI0022240C44|nr:MULTISPECIES: hypothetical protein [unclassified Flavobacterium]WCM42721.1 hypothetical protein MG290_03310 [Flavobacterium sp. CBA20B-1]
MYQKITLYFLCFAFIACSKWNPNIQTIDFSKDQDFRIINVFNEQRFNEYSERLPDKVLPIAESTEPYAFYSYLSLKPNKDFTFLIGNHFMHGTYKLVNKDEIVLQSALYGDLPLKILKEEEGCIQIHGDFKGYKSDFMLELEGNTNYYINLSTDFEKLDKENDIRSLAFNKWRFPAIQKETNQQIKERLIANLKYIAAYMRVHMYGGYDLIHTDGIHSPFLYARNGLFLYEWQRVPYFWKHVFYDEKDAEKAYKMVRNTFKVAEAPEFIDNWLFYNESCLRAVIAELEKQEVK